MNNLKMLWRVMETIDIHPEFAHELVCVIPYTYWLHKQGKLKKVITSKGMKPFYYFCDDVEEKYKTIGYTIMHLLCLVRSIMI